MTTHNIATTIRKCAMTARIVATASRKCAMTARNFATAIRKCATTNRQVTLGGHFIAARNFIGLLPPCSYGAGNTMLNLPDWARATHFLL